MNEKHKEHPDVEPFYTPLSPSLPSGTWHRCAIITGKWTNGNTSGEHRCNESYFEPTRRCQCAPGNHGVRATGNPWQPYIAVRTIQAGKCSECREIVPGYEEEADADASNW